MTSKSSEFKKLKAKWYKKLKENGFDDIEQDEDNLKVWSFKLFTVQRNLTLFSAKEEYYRWAGQFLHEHPFTNEFDKEVWSLHAEGQSNEKITKLLKSKGIKTTKKTIQVLVKGLVETMLSKYNVR